MTFADLSVNQLVEGIERLYADHTWRFCGECSRPFRGGTTRRLCVLCVDGHERRNKNRRNSVRPSRATGAKATEART